MKNVLFLILAASILTGCSYFQNSSNEVVTSPTTAPATPPNTQAVLDGNIKNLFIRESNFGTEEIIVFKDELLILSVRNQLEEPINIVIDELGVKTEPIEFGEVVEVTVPTNTPGEYEMYSSLGNQRNEGFSAVIVVDDEALE